MEFSEIIIRYLDGSATLDEQRQLLAWLEDNPDERREFGEIAALHAGLTGKSDTFDTQRGWDLLVARRYMRLDMG